MIRDKYNGIWGWLDAVERGAVDVYLGVDIELVIPLSKTVQGQ